MRAVLASAGYRMGGFEIRFPCRTAEDMRCRFAVDAGLWEFVVGTVGEGAGAFGASGTTRVMIRGSSVGRVRPGIGGVGSTGISMSVCGALNLTLEVVVSRWWVFSARLIYLSVSLLSCCLSVSL